MINRYISQLKHLRFVLKTRGVRYSFNRFLKKAFFNLENIVPSVTALETLPHVPRSKEPNYQKWLNKNYPTQVTLKRMAEVVDIFHYKPVISILMPVFNTPETFLEEAIESVLGQIYPYWELCIADDASTESHIRELLKFYQAKDKRIKVTFRETNGHICHCSNSALEIATGDFVALLDHDDLLTEDALYEFALLLNRHPKADMIYSDEDKIDEQGQLRDPFFKPDWCPDSFLSRMYTCHLGVYRRSIVVAINGFRPGMEGSQDYDLVLRFTEKTEQIFHIPRILYHWRIHDNSTASRIDNKVYATDRAKKSLDEALKRRGEGGKAVLLDSCSAYHIIRYKIHDFKLVTIIIPTKDLGAVLDRCLASIFEKTLYPNYEVLVIDNGSTEKSTFSVFDRWRIREPKRFHCQPLNIPFNYSTINNYAVQNCSGSYLLFLNNDTEVIASDWVDAMVEQVQRPQIGAVGARLFYPDGTIQHAGVVAGIGGVAGHGHKHFPGDASGYFSQVKTINNYSAVTAACLMCRRDVFLEVGGFEEDLAVAFNDVDFCFKLLDMGYRNIYLPHVTLYHHESKSRGYEDTPKKQERFSHEVLYMTKKWNSVIEHDPCYNCNLSNTREDYSLNI